MLGFGLLWHPDGGATVVLKHQDRGRAVVSREACEATQDVSEQCLLMVYRCQIIVFRTQVANGEGVMIEMVVDGR